MKCLKRNTWMSVAAFLAAGALAAADELPKAETILDKYIEATGGKAAYAKSHSEISTGTMEFAAMGLKGQLVAYAAEPDKRVAEFTLPGIGKILDGTDGEIAWASSAIQGPRVKDGDEKAEALLEAQFNADSHWRDIFKSAETVAMEPVDGKDSYKVVVVSKAGKTITRWYDKKTGLMLKSVMISKSPMGELEATSVFSDYRKEGDILSPHKVVAQVAGRELTMTVEKIEYNAEIPKGKFDLPDDIKALVKKPAQ